MASLTVLFPRNENEILLTPPLTLAKGRFCLSNTAGVNGSGIKQGYHLAEDASSFREIIMSLCEKEFSEQDIYVRKQIFELYNNHENAKKLNALW